MDLAKDSMKNVWYKLMALKPLLRQLNNREFGFINQKN